MNDTEWFQGYGVDKSDTVNWEKSSPSMFFDALLAAIMGWALLMCAIATALRAMVRR